MFFFHQRGLYTLLYKVKNENLNAYLVSSGSLRSSGLLTRLLEGSGELSDLSRVLDDSSELLDGGGHLA